MKLLGSVLLAALVLTAPVRAIDWPVVRRVSNISPTSVASLALPAIATGAGHQLVLGFSYQGAGTPSVANTGSDTWTQVGTEVTAGANKVRMYRAYNTTGHASDVVTVTFTGANSTYTSLSLYELTMVGTADPLLGSNQGSGTGTAISSGDVTFSSPAAVISHGIGNGGNIIPTNGYLWVSPISATNTASSQLVLSLIKLASTTQAATATQTSAAWAMVAGAFTVPSTPAGGATSGVF